MSYGKVASKHQFEQFKVVKQYFLYKFNQRKYNRHVSMNDEGKIPLINH